MDNDLTEIEISSNCLYSGRVVKLYVDDVRLPNGSASKREYVAHRGGAAVLAVDDEGCTYLVRQFRYAYKKMMLEIPAGKLEEGEEASVTAARELEEETGLIAGELESMGRICPSPGYTNEYLYIYFAKELKRGRAHLDEDEFVDVVRLPIEEAVRMAMAGEIEDAKTCYALLKYAVTHNIRADK